MVYEKPIVNNIISNKKSFDITFRDPFNHIGKIAFLSLLARTKEIKMVSDRYAFKSDNLWQQYQESKIDISEYTDLLEKLIAEEQTCYKTDQQDQAWRNAWAYENQREQRNKKKLDIQEWEEKSLAEKEAKKQDDERLKNLSFQEKYYEIEIPSIIEEYRTESKRYRRVHNQFQWAVMVGSVIVTSTTGATILAGYSQLSDIFKWTSVVCSILVSISAAATGYFKFRERSANLQETADDLEHEHKALQLEIDSYLSLPKKDALVLFAQNVESRIKEQKKREQQLEQPSDTNQVQIQTQMANRTLN